MGSVLRRRFVTVVTASVVGSIVVVSRDASADVSGAERSTGYVTGVSGVHWDASAQIGAQKRFVTQRPPAMDDATIGPAVQLAAHVALLPLVRVGGYLGADLSPGAGTFSARDFYSGGVRLKLMSPWPRGNVRTWLFFGFGAVGVYAPAREAGGHLFELPIGIGASYKFRKPWAFSAELGFRYGFGHGGSVYDSAYENRSDLARSTEPFQGIDRFALGLTIGVLADL